MYEIYYHTTVCGWYKWKTYDVDDALAMQAALMALDLPFDVLHNGVECVLIPETIITE